MRRPPLLLALSLAVLVAMGCSTNGTTPKSPPTTASPPSSTTTTTPATVAVVYAPWSAGKLVVRQTASLSGSCWESSIADSGRDDAWRCMTDNNILDPCFSDPGIGFLSAKVVACPNGVDLSAVTIINLSKPLPAPFTPPAGTGLLPWLIEGAGNVNCEMITGATEVVGGNRLNYGCTDKTSLFGGPDKTSPVWRILQAKPGSPEQSYVNIVKAWM